jgi:hypothetical protein
MVMCIEEPEDGRDEGLSDRERALVALGASALKARAKKLLTSAPQRARTELILHMGALSALIREEAEGRLTNEALEVERRRIAFNLDETLKTYGMPDLLDISSEEE